MGLTDRSSFRLVNDLVHDVTAGIVPGAVLSLWLVRNGAKASLGPAVLSTLVGSWSWIVLVVFVAMVVFIVTGSVRLAYRSHHVSLHAIKAQGRSALIKHAVFVVLFVFATLMAFIVIQP